MRIRPEIAVIIAVTIGLVTGVLLTLLGDGRAQYGAILILASLPIFYLIASVVMFLNFWLLQKLKRHSHLNYFVLGLIWATVLSVLIFHVGDGVIATFSFTIAIVITFSSFSLLIGSAKKK